MAEKIVVESLRKHFGSTVAVDDLTFAVRAGSVTGFLGPNGAGKTTTLRVLLGLVSASAGRATIDGQVYRILDHPTRKVGAVLEGANYHPGRSARNHLRVVASAGQLDRNRIDEMQRSTSPPSSMTWVESSMDSSSMWKFTTRRVRQPSGVCSVAGFFSCSTCFSTCLRAFLGARSTAFWPARLASRVSLASVEYCTSRR